MRGAFIAAGIGLLGGLDHDVCRPAVVGLPTRRALDGLDHVQLAGHLVPGDVAAAVDLDLVERGDPLAPGLDDGGHPLAPPLVGGTDHDGVEHVRV